MTTDCRPLFSADIARAAVAATLVVMTVAQGWVIHEVPGLAAGHPRLTVVYIFDILLLVALITNAPNVAGVMRSKARIPGVAVALLLLAATVFGVLVAPTLKGALIVFRVLGAVVLASAFLEMTDRQRRSHVVIPAMVIAGIQGVIASLQLAFDSSLGLDSFGGGPPAIVDGVARAPGTLEHPYLLAAYALFALSLGIAFRPRPTQRLWYLGVAASAVPIAVTFSRAALVGFVLVGVVLALKARSQEWRRLLVAIGVGFGLFALLFVGSWTSRIDDSTLSELGRDNIRYTLAEQGLDLIESDWLLGVGTGQYMIELEARFDIPVRSANPVHNVPLYLIAEWGIVGWALVLALGWFAIGVWKVSTEGRVLLLAPLGFVMLDALHAVYPIALMLAVMTVVSTTALSERNAATADLVADST